MKKDDFSKELANLKGFQSLDVDRRIKITYKDSSTGEINVKYTSLKHFNEELEKCKDQVRFDIDAGKVYIKVYRYYVNESSPAYIEMHKIQQDLCNSQYITDVPKELLQSIYNLYHNAFVEHKEIIIEGDVEDTYNLNFQPTHTNI